MEILLKQGDRLPIPDGCKAVIEGNVVLIEEKEGEFKDGDILVALINECRCNIFIYKGTNERGSHCYYAGLDMAKKLHISKSISSSWYCDKLSYATDEEKQLLFDKMKEKGLRWNAEEKKVEAIRWRAEKGEIYYFVGANGNISRYHEDDDENDKTLWRIYNYFQDYKQAEKAAEVVKKALRKFHEENG